jgi:hypothetical protein
MKKDDHGFFSKVYIFILYCLPGLLAVLVVVGANLTRAEESANEIVKYIKAARADQEIGQKLAELEDDFVLKRLEKLIKKQKLLASWTGQSLEQIEEEIGRRIEKACLINALLVFALTLLPFVVLGSGVAFSKRKRLPLAEKRWVSLKDIPMKFLVGAVIALGWLYFLNPYGQGASTVYSFLKSIDIVSADTVPMYFIFTNSPVKHIISGFLGWYLYLLGYFFYRFYRSDIVSTRLYSVLFRRFLFVFGAALILNSISKDEALLVIFLVGFFPISAVSAVKEFLTKKVEPAGDKLVSLTVLPGISRWEILRLEEEGVDSIAALATVDRETLKKNLPVRGELIDLWIDTAILMAVVGEDRYQHLRGICSTASEFINRSSDPAFRTMLEEKCAIYNSQELVKQMKTTFHIPKISKE